MKRTVAQVQPHNQKKNRSSVDDSDGSGNYRLMCRSAAEGSLYAAQETAACFAAGCVCCAYKLVVQPTRGRTYRPNKRPEECLREKQAHYCELPSGGVYRSLQAGSRVLTVGDGDLSFSLSLAQAVPWLSLVATTHLSRGALEEAYGADRIEQVLTELAGLGAKVIHSVDATKLHKNASVLESAGRGGEGADLAGFARVIWNFPCVAGVSSRDADAQVAEMETNKHLLRRFFRSCTKPGVLQCAEGVNGGGGEIHVSHKAKAPFCHWDIEGCAEKGGGSALRSTGALVFDRACFPGYGARKVATGSGSFPTWDAKTYMWELESGRGQDAKGAAPEVDLSNSDLAVQLREASRSERPLAGKSTMVAKSWAGKGSGVGKGGKGGAGSAVDKGEMDVPKDLVLQVSGNSMVRISEDFLDVVCSALKLS